MNVEFASNSLRRCYEISAHASRKWGAVVGRKYIQRIDILYSTPTFEDLYSIRSLGLHILGGQWEGKYAITIHDRWRLILLPIDDRKVRVQEVTNHYGQ